MKDILQLTQAPYKVREGDVTEQPEDEIWVRAQEGVAVICDKIMIALDNMPYVDMACIGAAAVNQATKAVALARDRTHTGDSRMDLYAQPYFSTVDDEEHDGKTRIMIRVVRKLV